MDGGIKLKICISNLKVFECRNNIICFDGHKFMVGSYNLQMIVALFKELKVVHLRLNVLDIKHSNFDIEILLALTLLSNSFIWNDEEYELSFAYVVPISKDMQVRNYILGNLEECLLSGQIVFLPKSSFYLFKNINKNDLQRILKRERKTIQKNQDTKIKEVESWSDFFPFWREYQNKRFGQDISEFYIKFFKKIYISQSYKLYQYEIDNNIIAYNVCYYSDDQRVIYDVLFPWKKDSNVYRIGIYSIIMNMKHAFEIGWGYSLCYGIYQYKNSIMKHIKKDIQD